MPGKVSDEITYPIPNNNGTIVEGNRLVISSHTLLGMCLLIHAGNAVNPC